MNFLYKVFMNFEPVEHSTVINGVSRYWTEMEPVGINWLSVAAVPFLMYFVYSLCTRKSL